MSNIIITLLEQGFYKTVAKEQRNVCFSGAQTKPTCRTKRYFQCVTKINLNSESIAMTVFLMGKSRLHLFAERHAKKATDTFCISLRFDAELRTRSERSTNCGGRCLWWNYLKDLSLICWLCLMFFFKRYLLLMGTNSLQATKGFNCISQQQTIIDDVPQDS